MQQRPILKPRKGLCYFFGLITKDPAPCFRPPEHLTGLMAVKILIYSLCFADPIFFPAPGWGSGSGFGMGIWIRLRDGDRIPESRQEKRPHQKNIIFPDGYISSPAPRSTDEAECSPYPLPSPKRTPGLSMLRSLRSLRCAASTARALRPLAAQPICNRGSCCSRQSGFAALAG